MYKNVLLILLSPLLYVPSTTLEFPFRRMVQVSHFKKFFCILGQIFYTNCCCFLVCARDMQLKRVCVENCRKLLHCWQVNVVLFIPSFIHLFIYLSINIWRLCFFSGLITRTGNTRYDHSLPFELIYQNINSQLLLTTVFLQNYYSASNI